MVDTPAIEVQSLHKTYHDGVLGRRSFEALKGVSLRVEHGEIFGLLGPNGAGKTTLVKVLLGIVRKTSGEARVLGQPAGKRAGRRQLGYLPENLRLPRHHTANSALDLYGQLSGLSPSFIRSRASQLLEIVDLQQWARHSVKKYSKGMLQRLGLAIALLHDPRLVFMDEPTDGLDPAGRAKVRQVLQRLKDEGKTVFLNSHLLQEVEMICDRVAILDRGVLRRVGTIDQLVVGQREGLRIDLRVHGDEEAIREALSNNTIRHIQAMEPASYELTLQVDNQQEVDRCVDALRKQRVSILALQRQRMSLEEAFLETVAVDAEVI